MSSKSSSFRGMGIDDISLSPPSEEVQKLNDWIVDLNMLKTFLKESPVKSNNRSLAVTKIEEAIHRLKDAIDEEDR